MSWDDEPPTVGGLLHRLRDEVVDLGDEVRAVSPRMAALDAKMAELGRGLREAELRALTQDNLVRETASLARRLAARVEWLERNIRLTEGAPEADLDLTGPEEEELARVAEAGNRVRSALLTASARSGLEEQVRAHAVTVREFGRQRADVLDACGVLADTGLHEGLHASAVARFQNAVADLDLTRQRMSRLAGAALDAQRRLREDDAENSRLTVELAESDRAWDQLNDRIRGRLAEAVGSGALLPDWFTGALGPMPPAHDSAGWMDTATSLIAYRVTYGVTDPVLPRGTDPPQPQARRRNWRDSLARQFQGLHG